MNKSTDKKRYWNEKFDEEGKSFVGCAQMFSDKTAPTLKSTAVVAQPVHRVSLNCSKSQKQWLIDNGLSLVGLFRVRREGKWKNLESEKPWRRLAYTGSLRAGQSYLKHGQFLFVTM